MGEEKRGPIIGPRKLDQNFYDAVDGLVLLVVEKMLVNPEYQLDDGRQPTVIVVVPLPPWHSHVSGFLLE